jgi:hypothetical protein
MSSVSAAPPFFGLVDAGLDRLLEDVPLLLATALRDGLLAGGEDRSPGSRRREMFHLVEKQDVVPEERFVGGVDLEREGRP